MKNILKLLILSIIMQFFAFSFYPIKTAYCYTASKAECVIEASTLRVISSKDMHLKLPIASTTKILTALTVIDNFSVDKIIKVDKKHTQIEGSSIYLKEGEELTVLELLYGLMLRSGNDCAECLASSLISRDEFINLMNKTAKNLGAINSNFTNPHGLPDDNHYSTAYDLALISVKAMQNDLFRKIVSTKSIDISNNGENVKRHLINKNKMLSNYEGANGIKTGYTKKAGRCLVSSATKNGMEIISVVLNSPQMWERSEELLDNAFNNYSLVKIFSKEDYNNEIFTANNGKKFKIIAFKDFYYPISKLEGRSLKYLFDGKSLEDFIKNPKENCVFEIYLENKLIFSQNIITIISR